MIYHHQQIANVYRAARLLLLVLSELAENFVSPSPNLIVGRFGRRRRWRWWWL